MHTENIDTPEKLYAYFEARGVGLIETGTGVYKLVKNGLNIKSSVKKLCDDQGPGYFVCCESPAVLMLSRRKDAYQTPEAGTVGMLYVIDTIKGGYDLVGLI